MTGGQRAAERKRITKLALVTSAKLSVLFIVPNQDEPGWYR